MHNRVSTGTHDLDQLSVPGAPSAASDPLLNCAVCSSAGDCEAGCPRLSVEDVPAAPPADALAGGSRQRGWLAWVFALCCDACAKATRFRLAGRSDNSTPTMHMYAGAANDKVQAAEAPGMPQDKDTLQDDCTASLTCANDRAYKRIWLDVNVMMAFVCRHGVPVRGAVCYSNRPETFLPYRILLEYLLMQYIIMFIMFDNGCRLSVSFIAQFAEGMGANLPIMLVGWMHARGHIERCRLQFSGLYHRLLGRTVGETTETFWAKFLNWEITRKMSRARRHDFLECVIKRIADDIEARMPEMLFSSWTVVHKKLAVCKAKVATILGEAASLNVDQAELERCTLEYVAQHKKPGGGTAGLPWEAELVKQYELAKVGVAPETALSRALIHGTGSLYNSAAARKRAESLIVKIESGSGRSIDVFSRDSWMAEHGEPATAALTASLLEEAKENVCVHSHAVTIAQEVENDRDGYVTPAQRRRMRGKHNRQPTDDMAPRVLLLTLCYVRSAIRSARRLLSKALVRYDVCALAHDETKALVLSPTQRERIMTCGQLPWEVDGSVGSAARNSLYRRWHDATNDLERTVEEYEKLKPKEAVRALNCYRATLRVIRTECVRLENELTAPTADATAAWAAKQSMLSAKLYLLRRHEMRVTSLQQRAGRVWAHGRRAVGLHVAAVPGITGVAAFLATVAAADAADAAVVAAASGAEVGVGGPSADNDSDADEDADEDFEIEVCADAEGAGACEAGASAADFVTD